MEDAHRLLILTADEVISAFLSYFDDEDQGHMQRVMSNIDDARERIAYLRSCVVGRLVRCCADAFVEAESLILNGVFDGCLLDHIPQRERSAYARCNDISWDKIYCAGDVVDVELAGNRIITFLLDKLIGAVTAPQLNYSRLLLAKFPGQYDVQAPTTFGRVQAVLDHISAMTDVYALDLYRKLCGSTLPAV